MEYEPGAGQPGEASGGAEAAGEALAIYEPIESPVAERVRRQMAEWQGES